ncbi:MAG: lasso peptide biosynthesis B2 protein [Clostridia bacterium]|nr:lasso peptide biosynthesis B2 protein [Clostridia bacterium]
MKAITGFLKLSHPQRLVALRLLWYIIRAEFILRFIPYATVQKIVFTKKPLRRPSSPEPLHTLNCHLRLLDMVCRNLPWIPTCLRKAIALHDSLAAHGIDSTIRIGVCRIQGNLSAHAWLECCNLEVLKNGTYSSLY